jgi:hypothetical protein
MKKMPFLLRKNLKLIFLLVGFLLLSLVFYFYSPAENGFYPSCVFKNMTGLSCPGCGSQRAFHELLHFNVKAAFAYNPLFILAIPYGLTVLISAKNQKASFQKLYHILTGKFALMFIGALIFMYFVWRNL